MKTISKEERAIYMLSLRQICSQTEDPDPKNQHLISGIAEHLVQPALLPETGILKMEDLLPQSRKSQFPPRHGEPWSTEERGKVLIAYYSGTPIQDIASTHQRTQKSIACQLEQIGAIHGPEIEQVAQELNRLRKERQARLREEQIEKYGLYGEKIDLLAGTGHSTNALKTAS